MDGLATTIARGAFPNNPAFLFQTMKQRHQRRFFNGEVLRDLGLGERFPGAGKVKKRAPARLAQSHGPEPLIELHPPGSGRAAEQKTEIIRIESLHVRTGRIVSRLTISSPKQDGCQPLSTTTHFIGPITVGSARRRNREQNLLVFTIIFNAQNHLRSARRPMFCHFRFFLVGPLDQEEFRVTR